LRGTILENRKITIALSVLLILVLSIQFLSFNFDIINSNNLTLNVSIFAYKYNSYIATAYHNNRNACIKQPTAKLQASYESLFFLIKASNISMNQIEQIFNFRQKIEKTLSSYLNGNNYKDITLLSKNYSTG
jgi:hypothetical protein